MKNLNKYLAFIFCAFVININAQNYFNKVIPIPNHQYAASIIELSTGGYLIAGQNSKNGMQTLYFMRTDVNGDTLWTKEYGKSQYYYYGSRGALHFTNDGNYIFAATVCDTTNNYDALLIKFKLNGDTLWTKKFGGPYFDAGRDCQQTVDGGYILVGDSDSLNNGLEDFLLIKTDSIGNKEWQRRYNAGNYEVAFTVEQTLDNGFIISGGRDLNSTNTSHWIVKTDSIGIMQWNKTYGSGGNDGGSGIRQLIDNNYLLIGGKQVTGMSKQACVRKLSSTGNLIWEKTFGSPRLDVFTASTSELSDNSYVIVGDFYNNNNRAEAGLVKLDTAGNLIWKRTYLYNSTVNNYTYDLKHTADNGFIISGQTINSGGDVWLVKVDSNGCEVANCNVGFEEMQVEKLKFKVFPNPCINEITVEINNANTNDYLFEIRNVLGELQKTEIQNTSINISQLASGIYFITAISKDGKQRVVEKFVKE